MRIITRKVDEEIIPVDSKRKAKRKAVRFVKDEELEQIGMLIPLVSELSQVEINLTWYSDADFRRFKQTARMISEESRASMFVGLLRNSYESSQEQLDLWNVHGRSQRGLEQFVSTIHGDQRRHYRKLNRDAVLDKQQELVASKADKAKAAIILAKTATASTKLTREFAARMGIADHRAVTGERSMLLVASRRRQSNFLLRDRTPGGWAELRRRPSQLLGMGKTYDTSS